MKTASKFRRLGLAVVALLLVGAMAMGSLYAQGFWDEKTAVHIKADEIETSTLAIGTHLIHLSALTDAIYTIAEESAGDSGQNQIYYKSELGEDAWFNITTATSLTDITTGGMPATDEEIEALFFTHHTKSDQVTYDLRTGQAVNIFDIRDPYDLEVMDEMSPLKMHYDQLKEMDPKSEAIGRIDRIWDTPVKGDEAPATIKKQADNLAALQRYLNVLTANDADAKETEKVSYVMEMVDAARRYEVFSVVKPVLDAYMDELGAAPPEPSGEEEEEVEEKEIDPELLSAVSETIGNVEGAIITNEGKMLGEGLTVISSAEYDFCMDLINHANADNHAACDKDVQNLLRLDNIQNSIISQRPEELELLESKLIPDATTEYLAVLRRGESAEYRAEVAKNSAQALLNRFVKEHQGDAQTRRGELEFLIQAKCDRMGAQDALNFVDERLELTTASFAATIPSDAFAEVTGLSVDDHITFLTDLRRQLELALGGNEMDKLMAQKEDLQTQRLEALDNNDLAGAKELEDQINAIEEEIRAIEEEVNAKIGNLKDQIAGMENDSAEKAAAEAELAALESSLSDGTLGAMIAGMKNDALDAIKGSGSGSGDGSDGGAGDVSAAIDALAGMLETVPQLALPALQDVYNELLLNNGDQSLIDAIEQAILENPNALRDDLSAEQIREAVRGWLLEQNGQSGQDNSPLSGAGGISRLNAYHTMSAIAGLNLYYEETGNRSVQQVMASLAQEQINFGNTLFYNRMEDSAGEYLPLSAIQALTGRRYVWEKNSSTGILAYGADYYGFTVYGTDVNRDRDGLKTDSMTRMTKYQNGVHIPEEYAYDQFGVMAVYLAETSLGCICDDPGMERAQELFTYLLSLE